MNKLTLGEFRKMTEGCPNYMWRINVEDWFCNIDGHIVPDKQCRCVFGKEWFDKNILHQEID